MKRIGDDAQAVFQLHKGHYAATKKGRSISRGTASGMLRKALDVGLKKFPEITGDLWARVKKAEEAHMGNHG